MYIKMANASRLQIYALTYLNSPRHTSIEVDVGQYTYQTHQNCRQCFRCYSNIQAYSSIRLSGEIYVTLTNTRQISSCRYNNDETIYN